METVKKFKYGLFKDAPSNVHLAWFTFCEHFLEAANASFSNKANWRTKPMTEFVSKSDIAIIIWMIESNSLQWIKEAESPTTRLKPGRPSISTNKEITEYLKVYNRVLDSVKLEKEKMSQSANCSVVTWTAAFQQYEQQKYANEVTADNQQCNYSTVASIDNRKLPPNSETAAENNCLPIDSEDES